MQILEINYETPMEAALVLPVSALWFNPSMKKVSSEDYKNFLFLFTYKPCWDSYVSNFPKRSSGIISSMTLIWSTFASGAFN